MAAPLLASLDLGTGHVGQRCLVLVEAAGLQRIRERHPGRVHIDDHSIGGGFIDVHQLRNVGTVQPGYLNGAHD